MSRQLAAIDYTRRCKRVGEREVIYAFQTVDGAQAFLKNPEAFDFEAHGVYYVNSPYTRVRTGDIITLAEIGAQYRLPKPPPVFHVG